MHGDYRGFGYNAGTVRKSTLAKTLMGACPDGSSLNFEAWKSRRGDFSERFSLMVKKIFDKDFSDYSLFLGETLARCPVLIAPER